VGHWNPIYMIHHLNNMCVQDDVICKFILPVENTSLLLEYVMWGSQGLSACVPGGMQPVPGCPTLQRLSPQNLPTTPQKMFHQVVDRDCKPTRCSKLYQTCCAKTQATSKWSMVSSSWSHRMQCSWWGRPLRGFEQDNQQSNIYCGQLTTWKTYICPVPMSCQILSQGLNCTAPRNMPS